MMETFLHSVVNMLAEIPGPGKKKVAPNVFDKVPTICYTNIGNPET